MQEQQGKLLTLLSPIIPLIEAIPLHIDSAKNDIKQSVREVNALTTTLQDSLMLFKNEMSASVSTCFRPTPVRLVPLSPVSSPRRSTPRKRRRTTDNPEDLSSSELATEPLPGLGPTLDEINTKSVRPALAPNAIASSSQLCYPTTTESYGTSQTLVYDENYSSNLDRSLSDPSDSESAHPIVSSLTASGPREPEGLAHPIHQPLHFHTIPEEPVGVYSSSPPAVIAVIAQDSRPSTGSSSPHMSNAFNARPTDSTSKTPVPMTIPAPKLHCSEVDETVVPSSHAVEPASTLHSVQLPVHLSNVRPTISRPLSDIAIGSSGASKPMSLKDRRARDPLIESTMVSAASRRAHQTVKNALQNKPGKRFIPFDDLDDDELEGDVL
ncbi:hypothetical protein BC835DRAFT_190188 [Cytidiella melzeri]|nr:hypothetical protein BC835DRAFT_190188 [Cytidiella melzeri]